ncbi:MAG: DUF4139 domain-containing protein [Bacteroidetes bacterium]|nr:DUF4139 domain-containing protein [Bacteroidota bacterium]
MQIKLLIPLLLSLPFLSSAEDTLRVRSGLRSANVYFGYGAELTHEGRVRLENGSRLILLEGISTSVDPNSLQVNLPEGIALLSQQFRVYQPAVPPSKYQKQIEALLDSNRQLTKDIARFQNLISIDQEILNKTGLLIESSLNGKSDRPVLAADILRMLEVYTARIEKAKLSIFQHQTAVEKIQQSIQENLKKIQQWSLQQAVPLEPQGQLLLQVVSERTDDFSIQVSYYTPQAGWTANYDLRVNSKENKMKLVYKASLTQTTGIPWKQVKLTLSTGTPNFGVEAPILAPWYLQLYVPALYKDAQARSVNGNRNVIQSMQGSGVLSDQLVREENADQYRLAPAPYSVDPSTLGNYTTLQQGQLNTSYEISIPYDVPSDGQIQQVNIQERLVDAGLKNYSVPKLDQEAYLMAELANWQNLDLIPGFANIIMDNTYIGKTQIDPQNTADTLNLSLGRDKRIVVKRTQVRESAPSKSGGGMQKQLFTYEITVKNNKVTPVQMLLKDQHPLSAVKEIEVSLEESGDAEVNPETGVLTWKVDLKPGESKSYRFVYSVKHPRDKRIVNL